MVTGFGDGEVGYRDTARKTHLGDILQIRTQDAEFAATHHGVRSDGAQCNGTGILVGIVLFVLTAGQGDRREAESRDGSIFQYIFHNLNLLSLFVRDSADVVDLDDRRAGVRRFFTGSADEEPQAGEAVGVQGTG